MIQSTLERYEDLIRILDESQDRVIIDIDKEALEFLLKLLLIST